MIFGRWHTWSAETRESWRFRITKNDNAIPDAGGIYLMVKRTCIFWLKPVYIGKASNLQSRLIGHERWIEAQKKGASERHFLCVRSESKRQRIEEDLIRKHRPKLNRKLMPKDACDAPNHKDLKRRWMCAEEYYGIGKHAKLAPKQDQADAKPAASTARDYYKLNDKAA
ncbi:MAG: GIY-YIG nuclease family protein [Henriciella sp.]|jgi:hypothetical protein